MTDGELEPLRRLLAGRRFVALTGAGCSTESGIPDYRGEGRTGPKNPIQHDAFIKRVDVRRRYWARATLGWPRFSAARPNAAHQALAALERAGLLAGVITQNVDRLHHAAGSRRVVELHGALAEVRCLDCGAGEAREGVQERMLRANPAWRARAAAAAAAPTTPPSGATTPAALRSPADSSGVVAATGEAGPAPPIRAQPDGDAELDDDALSDFDPAACAACGGVLKPDVVFFGGTVSEATRDAAFELCDAGEALLVVGSSLAVFSGLRFVRRASGRGVPIAIVNIGPTRADELAQVRVQARAGDVLPRLARALGPADPHAAAPQAAGGAGGARAP